ncbi:uncharacterized protein BDZ99DRAFT_19666 [Mytilinidion resinicola]|uniref:Zn(2)-C6 fungal-type domain-containing protein n=1 Tax=Mytilinidion resinicola TaxID=574789 RepID=A0A6A6ZBB1_9PEZI|nr:uncharacterized protein BDZ99DRAFT_19666 [Mytilinidion resinicola]KAF2817594.1 hypothetical protein BDZ99DRAFT_19666 [Mytilinidion resinicola]
MVGVPGRSKGCKTCRARKKGCDLQRPQCGQCIRSKVMCGGYNRDLTIIQHNPSIPVPRSRTDLSRRTAAKPRPDQTALHLRAVSSFEPLPQNLGCSAFETKTFELFWTDFLPRDHRCSTQHYGIPAVTQWAKAIEKYSPGCEVLRSAFRAVSTSRIGLTSGNAAMTQQAIELYGRALAQVNRALRDPQQVGRVELVASCKLLAMFEQYNSAKDRRAPGTNWIKHVQGVGRLIELRGPQQHCSDDEHIMFIDARLPLVIAAIGLRKATYLARPEWNTLPWERKPKTIRDELVSIFALFPAILAEHDTIQLSMKTPNCAELAKLQGLVRRCWRIDQQLQRWSQRFSRQLSDSPLKIRLMADAFTSDPGSLSPEDFVPLGYDVLYTAVLYWTACLYTYNFLHTAIKTLSEHESDKAHVVLPTRTYPKLYAINISRLTKYFFREYSGLFSSQAITFPLSSALQYVAEAGGDPEVEFAELVNTMQQLSKMPSYSWIGHFMRGMRAACVSHRDLLVLGSTTSDSVDTPSL